MGEHCDLTPQQTCHHKTRLVPRLEPVPECTILPKEVCNIKYVHTRIEKVPFTSVWCQDEDIEIETETDTLSEGSETDTSTQTIPETSTEESIPIVGSSVGLSGVVTPPGCGCTTDKDGITNCACASFAVSRENPCRKGFVWSEFRRRCVRVFG